MVVRPEALGIYPRSERLLRELARELAEHVAICERNGRDPLETLLRDAQSGIDRALDGIAKKRREYEIWRKTAGILDNEG